MTTDETRNLVASMRRFLETAWVGLHQENMAREQMARAADALAETLPEERDGRCLCGHCEHVSGRWCEFSPTWPDGEPEAGPVRWSHCPDCGAHLGADGIARRNADAARVERVRDLIADGCAAYPETIWPQPTPEEPGSEAERRAECWVATGARLAYRNMRAALDGQDQQAATDGEPTGLAAIIGKWPGDETDAEIAEALAALRPPHPDTQRMDALERMVAESAKRGEAVEIDGRSPGLVLLSRWWPGGALEHVSNGTTLQAAIDAAMGAGESDAWKL